MQKLTSRITVAELIIVGHVMITEMINGKFLIGVVILVVPGILFLLAGSPIRVLSVILGLQIVLRSDSSPQLSCTSGLYPSG